MKKKNLVLTPLLGIILFFLLYIVATFFYPGGSKYSASTKGFDWLHNYWCDLTDEVAMNGEINPARAIALPAMLILFSTLVIFWLYLPQLFQKSKYNQIIRYAGVISMVDAFFMFTTFHNIVINVAGIFGIVALTGTLVGLYKNKFYNLFGYGLFCLLLTILNFVIFDTGWLLSFLPIIQKVTFVLILAWICLIDIYLYRAIKSESVNEHQ